MIKTHDDQDPGNAAPNRREQSPAHLVEAPPRALQPRPHAVRQARQHVLHHELDGHKGRGHDHELRQQAAPRIDELRQERAVEQQRLGIGDRRQETLAEHARAAQPRHVGRRAQLHAGRTP
ncbi:hypothetical protein O9649_21920 [Achromobacter dolens]|nr:hypothetical protein [Achromobacter dolens]MCZ8410454.1 hypothetical protein [Achromobacter dolens]